MSEHSNKRKLVISCERLLLALFSEHIQMNELRDALFFLPQDYFKHMTADVHSIASKYPNLDQQVLMSILYVMRHAIRSAAASGRLALHDPQKDGWQQLNNFLSDHREGVTITPAGPFSHENVVLSALDKEHGELPYYIVWENQEAPILV